MRHVPVAALALLCLAMAGLTALLLEPRHPQALTLGALVAAPAEELAVAMGLAAPAPWDDSPAVLATRTKTSACAVNGPLPDPGCTPGAVFASSTPAAICVTGYTKTVRNVSTKTKKQVYAAYGVTYPQPTGSYEVDHLVPLELGGSNDIANLFPEAAATSSGHVGFREKDLVENYLHERVCDGAMPLPRAEEAIAHDWVAVYRTIPASDLARLKAAYSSWADKN